MFGRLGLVLFLVILFDSAVVTISGGPMELDGWWWVWGFAYVVAGGKDD